jgi:hypothetical protein
MKELCVIDDKIVQAVCSCGKTRVTIGNNNITISTQSPCGGSSSITGSLDSKRYIICEVCHEAWEVNKEKGIVNASRDNIIVEV